MSSSKGFSAIGLVVSVVIVLVLLGGVGYFVYSHIPTAAPVTTDTGKPTEKTTDMAPTLPNNQKTAIEVMHSDSSYEKFLVPNTTVDTYAKSLPQGDKIVSQTPLTN